MNDKHQARSRAATAAYETDGRIQWQPLQQSETDWHQTFNNLLDKGHIFMDQTYTDTGMLFRGMPAGLAEAMDQNGFWHCRHDNPLCQLERELDVIFCSEVARDALAVARPWQDKAKDAAILIFSSKVFVERWQARTAAMLGFADVGMVFKYPCLAAPLDWSDLHGIVLHSDAVSACESLFAGWPEIQRPHIAAPAVADVTCREAWQAVIDKMLSGQQLTAAVSPQSSFHSVHPDMNRHRLGQTQEYVTAIGLGAMPLTMSGRPDAETARRVIEYFINAGGEFIDTANVYSESPDSVGENERLVAGAVAEADNADNIVIATKGGLRRTQSGWDVDASPAWLQQSCDISLHALNTDCIDLYQLHAPDPGVDIRDSVRALAEMQEAGKIRMIGLCNVDINQIQAAQSVAPVTSVQNALHPRRKKSLHNGVVDYCRNAGISFIAHSPVGGYHRYRELHDDDVLVDIARRNDSTPACISLAWLLDLGVLPIAGARRYASVQASLESMSLQLDEQDIVAINALEDW